MAASAEGSGWRVASAPAAWTATLATVSSPVSSSIEGCEKTARRSSLAPRVTKNSGTKKPAPIPVTWVESRFGPPISATSSPTEKPAIRMLVPARVAIHASVNSASSAKRRSSAQPRRFDARRMRCRNARPRMRWESAKIAPAAPATASRPSTAPLAFDGWSTSGSETIDTTSAIPTCAISGSTRSSSSSFSSWSSGSRIAADPLASNSA